MKFHEIVFEEKDNIKRARLHFENGYGASIVCNPGPFFKSYGGDQGLYEIAVLKDNSICYTTPITSDVIGHLSEADVEQIVNQIKNL